MFRPLRQAWRSHAVLLLLTLLAAAAQVRADDKSSTWAKIAPHFQPPAEFADDLGRYRSPLEFHDGREVRSPKDWKARREEILARWHKLLGPWPELIDKPQVKYLETRRRGELTQHRVHVQVGPGQQFTEGHLLLPAGDGPFPAVLVTFYDSKTSIGEGEKGRGLYDYGLQLARRGFVTLSIGTPGSIEQPKKRTRELLIELGEKQNRQPLSYLAYAAANCQRLLALMKEVDPKRIGVVGLSYGGKWSMFASCLHEKFACAVWSDPGIVFDESNRNINYWEPWYLGYQQGVRREPGVPSDDRPRTGLYRQLYEQHRWELDLHELHALMAPRPFLVSGGSEDGPQRWQALNHTLAVNRLLGKKARVAMTYRQGHIPTPAALEKTCLFLEYFLKK